MQFVVTYVPLERQRDMPECLLIMQDGLTALDLARLMGHAEVCQELITCCGEEEDDPQPPQPFEATELASFPGLHAQLLSLAVRKAGGWISHVIRATTVIKHHLFTTTTQTIQ